MHVTSRTVAAGAALVLWLGLAAQAAADPTGRYAVYGVNPDGTRYEGTVSVAPHEAGEGAYDVVWRIVNDAFTGIGLLDGEVFAVSYTGRFSGLAIYREVNPGVWQGTWTSGSTGTVGEEVWER